MDQINAYNRTSAVSSANTQNTRTGGKSSLDMQDFMNLLAAQMSNQDVMNPSTDTEFISQMAQFTSLQAMQTMTEITYAQYGASMIGKTVVVASYDSLGQYSEDTGVVENIIFAGGDCLLSVNGAEYTMSSIMKIVTETGAADTGDNGSTDDGADKGEVAV